MSNLTEYEGNCWDNTSPLRRDLRVESTFLGKVFCVAIARK